MADQSPETSGLGSMQGETDAERRARYRAAFARLPWVQREVFRCHRIEGLSYGEIAALMKVSEEFVERQMAKALYKLVRQMHGDKLKWWERWG